MTKDQLYDLVRQRAMKLEYELMAGFNFPIDSHRHEPSEQSMVLAARQIVTEIEAKVSSDTSVNDQPTEIGK